MQGENKNAEPLHLSIKLCIFMVQNVRTGASEKTQFYFKERVSHMKQGELQLFDKVDNTVKAVDIQTRANRAGLSGQPYLFGYLNVDPAVIGDLTIEEIGLLIAEIITFHHHCYKGESNDR